MKENNLKNQITNNQQEKAITPISPSEKNSSSTIDEYNNKQNAGFFVRLQAQIIDWLINSCIVIFLWFRIFLLKPQLKDLLPLIGINLYVMIFIFPVLLAIYRILTTSKFGGTLGKLLSGLKITFAKQRPLTVKESAFRYFVGYFVSGLFYGLGFLWIIRDSEKKAWHDHLCGTIVIISNESLKFIGTAILILLIGFNIILLKYSIQSIKVNTKLQSEVVDIWEELKSSTLEIEDSTDTIKPTTEELII